MDFLRNFWQHNVHLRGEVWFTRQRLNSLVYVPLCLVWHTMILSLRHMTERTLKRVPMPAPDDGFHRRWVKLWSSMFTTVNVILVCGPFCWNSQVCCLTIEVSQNKTWLFFFKLINNSGLWYSREPWARDKNTRTSWILPLCQFSTVELWSCAT